VPTCPAFTSVWQELGYTTNAQIEADAPEPEPELQLTDWQRRIIGQLYGSWRVVSAACSCGEPLAPNTEHRSEGPCVTNLDAPDRRSPAEAALAYYRERYLAGIPPTWPTVPGPDVNNAYGRCPLCRKPFERDEQRIEVLQNGGDSMGPRLCVPCAMDRPTNLIPALRPVGYYATDGEADPANDGDRCPHETWVSRFEDFYESCASCGAIREREETPAQDAVDAEEIAQARADVEAGLTLTLDEVRANIDATDEVFRDPESACQLCREGVIHTIAVCTDEDALAMWADLTSNGTTNDPAELPRGVDVSTLPIERTEP